MLTLALTAAMLAGPTYRLGAADITPAEPLPLGGYTARGGKPCELPGDKLEARAIVLQEGTLRVAIVSCDLLTIPESLHREVSKKMPDGVKLMLVATHTHCAPDSQMLNERLDFSIPGIAKFRPEQLRHYAERIGSAVRRALENHPRPLDPVEMSLARLSLNRGRRQGALADTLAIRLRAGNDTLIASYSAHAVLYGPAENRPRTDFPGKVRGESGLFLPGAIGDMSPASSGSSPAEQITHFAQKFESGPWRKERIALGPLKWISEPILLSPVAASPEFARLNGIPQALAQSVVQRFAPTSGAITAVRLGKLALIGVPGEPTAELGRQIRSIGLGLGFRAVVTVSHTNGWIGYILAREDYARGGYEASLSFHGPGTGEQVVSAAKRALERLAR